MLFIKQVHHFSSFLHYCLLNLPIETIAQNLYTIDIEIVLNNRREGRYRMSEPTARELLVQLTREEERLRLLDLADRCRSLDELKDCLRAMMKGVV